MSFKPKHLTPEEIKGLYRLPLARLEQVIMAEHMSKVIEPDYEPSLQDQENLAQARVRIERLEADLAEQLDGRE